MSTLREIAGFAKLPLPSDPESEDYGIVLALLEEFAHAFLRVGRLTLRDWAKATPIERVAFSRAQEKIEIAERVRHQQVSPAVIAADYRKFDGGHAFRQAVLNEAAARIAEGRRHGGSQE